MADKNDNNKYVLLMHHNPQVKTIEDFMDSEHIYEVDDEGYVLPNSQASDSFFDFNKDLYAQSIRVFFIEKIRDEVKFNNLEVLKEQLLHDRNCAKEFFDKHPLAEF